jgi:hypothetical protein
LVSRERRRAFPTAVCSSPPCHGPDRR